MTIYEVMEKGHSLVASDSKQEHVVTWNGEKDMTLWCETEGQYDCVEIWVLKNKPDDYRSALLVATKMLLNVRDEGLVEKCIVPPNLPVNCTLPQS